MLLWAVVASTYEEAVGDAFPVVIHTMMSKTREGALGVFRAHMETDSFLRGCTDDKKFKSIDCRTELAILRYDTETKRFIET
jgi:hypothetical protein